MIQLLVSPGQVIGSFMSMVREYGFLGAIIIFAIMFGIFFMLWHIVDWYLENRRKM